jgi:uncharacterized membrane protein YidH (DUF202 family)
MKASIMSSTSGIPSTGFSIPPSNSSLDAMTILGVFLIILGIILLVLVAICYFARGIKKENKLVPIEKILLATGALVTLTGIVLAIL